MLRGDPRGCPRGASCPATSGRPRGPAASRPRRRRRRLPRRPNASDRREVQKRPVRLVALARRRPRRRTIGPLPSRWATWRPRGRNARRRPPSPGEAPLGAGPGPALRPPLIARDAPSASVTDSTSSGPATPSSAGFDAASSTSGRFASIPTAAGRRTSPSRVCPTTSSSTVSRPRTEPSRATSSSSPSIPSPRGPSSTIRTVLRAAELAAPTPRRAHPPPTTTPVGPPPGRAPRARAKARAAIHRGGIATRPTRTIRATIITGAPSRTRTTARTVPPSPPTTRRPSGRTGAQTPDTGRQPRWLAASLVSPSTRTTTARERTRARDQVLVSVRVRPRASRASPRRRGAEGPEERLSDRRVGWSPSARRRSSATSSSATSISPTPTETPPGARECPPEVHLPRVRVRVRVRVVPSRPAVRFPRFGCTPWTRDFPRCPWRCRRRFSPHGRRRRRALRAGWRIFARVW